MRSFERLTMSITLGVLACASAACAGDGGDPEPQPVVHEQVVGAAGGTIATADGSLRLVVPAGALVEDTKISVRAVAAPAGSELIEGAVYELEPDGLRFVMPAELTIRYPEGTQGDLQLAKYTPERLIYSEHVAHDRERREVTARIAGFSTRGVAPCPGACVGGAPRLTKVELVDPEYVLLEWDTGGWPTIEIERAETVGSFTDRPADEAYALIATRTGGTRMYQDRALSRDAKLYHYRLTGIRGQYASESTPPHDPIVWLGVPGDVVPAAPMGFVARADANDPTAVHLTWSGSLAAERYLIDIRTATSGFTPAAVVPATSLFHTLRGLQTGTEYTFRLRAENDAGASTVVLATATPGVACRIAVSSGGVELDASDPRVPFGAQVTLRHESCGDPSRQRFVWLVGPPDDATVIGRDETATWMVTAAITIRLRVESLDGLTLIHEVSVRIEIEQQSLYTTLQIEPGLRIRSFQTPTFRMVYIESAAYIPITDHPEAARIEWRMIQLPNTVLLEEHTMSATWAPGTPPAGARYRTEASAFRTDGSRLSTAVPVEFEVVQ